MSKDLTLKQESTQITLSQLNEIYSPDQCMREFRMIKTISQALEVKTPSVGTLMRALGEKATEAYIKLWILDLDTNLELKHRLKPHQIDSMAFKIVDEFRSLTIADLNILFQGIKFGERGNFFDRITIPQVMKIFRDYFNDRCDVAAEKSYQKHVQLKAKEPQLERTNDPMKIKEQIRQSDQFIKNENLLNQTNERLKKAKKSKNN